MKPKTNATRILRVDIELGKMTAILKTPVSFTMAGQHDARVTCHGKPFDYELGRGATTNEAFETAWTTVRAAVAAEHITRP